MLGECQGNVELAIESLTVGVSSSSESELKPSTSNSCSFLYDQENKTSIFKIQIS